MKLISLLAVAGLTLASHAADPVDVLPDAAAGATASLDGTWMFKYVAASQLGADESFHGPKFDDRGWATIPVPGHWEMHGFAEPKYKRVDEGTGLYRREFEVPSGWTGGRIMLRLEGVQYGFTAWINGREVGSWASSYNPSTFDITDAVQRGAKNTLAVRVTTRSQGWEFDTNDCWALSGIFREVRLLHVPAAHVRDYTARTRLRPDGSAELQLTVAATGPGQVKVLLRAPGGQVEREAEVSTDARGHGELAVTVTHPQLWTAETPALYGLELAYAGGAGSVHRVVDRIGLREVSIADGVLQLNGRAIKLRGVNHHEIWPDEGRVATEALLRRDLEMMRAANINFVRTSHYPPHPRLVELCDELGLYVMCEVPFGFGDKNLSDPAFEPVLRTRARATVKRDQNRPSVIIWSIGNENPLTELVVKTATYTREIDPSRPVCIPTVGSYFAANLGQFVALPEAIGVFAPHYPGSERAQDYATRLARPIIFTEFSHALGLAFDGTETLWDIFERSPRIAGGAVWMFQDQGIRRAVATTGQPKNGAMYVWPDAGHYFDTAGTDGCDGIVYSDRTPQVDYWQLRKVYAPVTITERSVTVPRGEQAVRLHVANRHDFISLEGFRLDWKLRVNGTVTQSGTSALRAPARSQEPVDLAVAFPAAGPGDVCWLDLACVDPGGRAITERSVRLQSVAFDPAAALRNPGPAPAALVLETVGATTRVRHPGFSVVLQGDTGTIQILSPDNRVLVAGIFPHAGRRFTLAETLRIERERREATESTLRDGAGSIWTGVAAQPGEVQQATAVLDGGIARITVRGRFPRLDRPASGLAGEVILEIAPDGRIEVRYDFLPYNGEGTLLEAGLALALPAAATDFRWIGAGLYAGYPGKDALNEFGIHHLTAGDLRFNGNRRGVEIAALTAPDGVGLALAGRGGDVAVESGAGGLRLSHNAVLAGRGNKGSSPEIQVHAGQVGHIRGQFALFALGPEWLAPMQRWFGRPGDRPPPFVPFVHSYDQ